jgi:hypothetical protein
MHKFRQPESSRTGVHTSAQSGRSVGNPPPAEEPVWSQSCLQSGAAKVRIQVLTQPDRGHSTKDYNRKKNGKTRSNPENMPDNSFVSNAAYKHTCFQIFTTKHLRTKRLHANMKGGYRVAAEGAGHTRAPSPQHEEHQEQMRKSEPVTPLFPNRFR